LWPSPTLNENRASARNRIVLKASFSTVKRKRRRRTVRNFSVTLSVLLLLVVASLGCGGGNHP
jgi:hypothetical protein